VDPHGKERLSGGVMDDSGVEVHLVSVKLKGCLPRAALLVGKTLNGGNSRPV